ncbi:MAG: hypothetical protein HRU20_21215 [Pseudomonadales bacterium]|nr:hypothetical protein [Pseudomonadales bacterium]
MSVGYVKKSSFKVRSAVSSGNPVYNALAMWLFFVLDLSPQKRLIEEKNLILGIPDTQKPAIKLASGV